MNAESGSGGTGSARLTSPATDPRPTRTRSNRSRRRLTRSLRIFGLLAGIAGAIVVVVVTGQSGKTGPTGAHAIVPPAAAVPSGITVDPAAYRGRGVDVVMSELSAKGLNPRRTNVTAAGIPDTVVTIVGSDGGPLPATLARGATVVVQVVGQTTPAAR